MKRLNSGQPDRQREREREREGEKRKNKKLCLMTDRITFTVFDFVVCLFAVSSLSLFKNIDCRYLLEPPFQVRTIYVLRKIPKLVFEKHHFTAIQIAVFSVTLQFGEFRLVALFPK